MVFRSLSSPGFDSTGKQFDLFTSAISRTKPERTFPGPTSTSKSQVCVSVLTREMKSTCEITWFAKCSCSRSPSAAFCPSTLENRDTAVSLSVSGTTLYLLRRSAAAETSWEWKPLETGSRRAWIPRSVAISIACSTLAWTPEITICRGLLMFARTA